MIIENEIIEKISKRFGGTIQESDNSYLINTSNHMVWFTISKDSETDNHWVAFHGRGGHMGTTWNKNVFKDYETLCSKLEQLFIEAFLK